MNVCDFCITKQLALDRPFSELSMDLGGGRVVLWWCHEVRIIIITCRKSFVQMYNNMQGGKCLLDGTIPSTKKGSLFMKRRVIHDSKNDSLLNR